MEKRILIANEGMTYTNGYAFSKEVWLGVTDSPDNWYEITDAEAEKQMKSMETEVEPEWL